MSIGKLPSGKYRARAPIEKQPDGKWRYASKSFTRKRDAEKWLEAVKVAKENGRVELLDADLITLAELAAEHMKAERPNLSAATYSTYRDLWSAHVVGRDGGAARHAIADMPLRAITPTVVEKFAADRMAAGAGRESIRKLLALMQTIFNRALRDERISRNPVALVNKPKPNRREGITPTTPEEVEKLRAKLDGADQLMVSLLAYAGLRPGEARGLKWGDVGDRSLHVQRAIGPEGEKPTKTTERRNVPIASALRADLDAWRRTLGKPADSDYVIARADGTAWTNDNWKNWQRRRFRTAAKAAGVKIARPYDLRHSIASLWIAEGRNVVEVASWLGHDPSMTLRTYAHVIADRDPKDERTVDERVMAARRDISVTYDGGKARQPAVKRKARKPRKSTALAESA